MDHITVLVDMHMDPSRVGSKLTIRDFGRTGENTGEARYYFDRYLRKRNDANIKNLTDLINKSRYYKDMFGRDTRFRDVRSVLQDFNKPMTLDLQERDFSRLAFQQIVMQCMASLNLDAIAYPTGNIPAAIIKAPIEPDVNGRSHQAWTDWDASAFLPSPSRPVSPRLVYDRVRDPNAPGGTRLVGPVPQGFP